MSNFSFLSDSDEDLAVEEIISQAKDLCVLEQISKINCSGFTDSDLPSELEARFRKLKSFPVSKPVNPIEFNKSKSLKGNKGGDFEDSATGKEGNFLGDKQNPDGKLGLEKELRGGSVSSPLAFENSSIGEKTKQGGSVLSDLSASDLSDSWVDQLQIQETKMSSKSKPKLKSKSGSLASPTSYSGSDFYSMDSLSPPSKQPGCFWCSPRKVSRSRSERSWSFDRGKKGDGLLLSDLKTFSVKEQEKILRKAMEVEEKISREAEKIVKLAKQASARMSFHGIDYELSDDDHDSERKK